MVSRNLIRIKVMQALYMHTISGKEQKKDVEKSLVRVFTDMYDLFLLLMSVFEALTFTAEQIIDVKKQKYLPTEKDLKPNLKFIDNRFIKKISQNTDLQTQMKNRNLSWHNDVNLLFVRKVYDQLSNHPLFVAYMQSETDSFEQDKQFVLDVIKDFVLDNELLMQYFGEQHLNWYHDYNYVVILLHGTLKTWTEKQKDSKALPSLFKLNQEGVSEDKQFLVDLFNLTIDHEKEYEKLIADKIQNWEQDRIATIDFILLKMAICEFCNFPTIPLRVTLNEYIEISKYYSTPKSRLFINGLLDKILLDLKNNNKIHKQGRGLMG
ncbi:MAG: transcription antitermination factor NusB [Bacteroidales bacterium]|nr:transcription antitermination factor NusB [Bacteroidales bacterium]